MLAVCRTMVFSHVGYACSVWNHGVLSCGLCLQCVEPWCSVMWAMLAVCGTMVFSGLCLQCVEPWYSVMWTMLAVWGTVVFSHRAMLAVCRTMVFSLVGYACNV